MFRFHLFQRNANIVETKTSKLNKNEQFESKDLNQSKKNDEILRQEFNGPIGILQRIKPKQQELAKEIVSLPHDLIDTSEEFDSDELVENKSDWHDELNLVEMPHLLGPSATLHSPVPVMHQHISTFSAPPFSCHQILVEFGITGPIFSLVPCSMQLQYHSNYDFDTRPINYNQYQPPEQFNPHYF